MAKTRPRSLHRCLTLGALLALNACGGSPVSPHRDGGAAQGGSRAPSGSGNGDDDAGPTQDGAGTYDATRVGPPPDASASGAGLDGATPAIGLDAATVPVDGPGAEPRLDAGTSPPSPDSAL